MTFAQAEADRRIGNMLAVGTVTAVAGDGTARVQIGDLATPAIPVGVIRAGAAKVWWMPSVGEQVVVAAPSGDVARAVILCSLFASNAPSSDVATPMIDLTGGDMVIRGGKIRIEADLDVTGRIDVTGDVASGANVSAGGDVTAGGDVQNGGGAAAGGVSLQSHVHEGVSPGSSQSGPPA